MQSESPIATCTYGWGRVFRLYNDYLEVNGVRYALNGLTHVRQLYRSIMGIPSAHLELYFGERKLVLAGIPEIEDAQKTVVYLTTRLNESHTTQQEKGLPEVAAPVRMLPGEHAHYITDAALCGERNEIPQGHLRPTLHGASLQYFGKFSSSPYGRGRLYPVLDQGMLILTSRRVIYIGRKGQVMLDYSNLLHVSRLRGAIALQADQWQKQHIFAMRRPLECAMYLEYILQRLQEKVTSTYPEPNT